MNKRSIQIHTEQVKLLLKLMPIGLIATVLNSSIVAILMLRYVPDILLLVWISAIFVVTIIRAYWLRMAKPDISQEEKIRFWENIFVAGIFSSGIVWGCAAFFGLFHASEALRLLVAYVLGGMAAGASATFSAVPRAYLAFTIPVLLP